jgi:hypothetical protein
MADRGFRITRVPRVNTQLRELAHDPQWQKAKHKLVTALRHILRRLKTDPRELGEPCYPTKKPGGMVRIVVEKPVSVTFAVFANEKVVFLLDVIPLSPPTDE